MKGSNKKTLLAVLAGLAVVVVLIAGISMGRALNEADNIIPENNGNSEGQEIFMPTDIYRLVRAWDDYMTADVKQAEVFLKLESKAFAIDEHISVQAGKLDGKPLAHIKKGMIDAYIYNNTLYIEDEAKFDIVGREFSVEDIDVKEMLEFIYKLANNSEFAVEETENGAVYRLTLTQQQIEQLIGESLGQISETDVAVKKGELIITTENNALAGLDIICDGVLYILNFETPLTLSVNVETTAVNGGEISVPKFIKDKMK